MKKREFHGMTSAPEYKIWFDMRKRCSDHRAPSFAGYGGRGIRVCRAWNESFAAFYADMGPRPSPRHSIERRDNNAGYGPDNCSWETQDVQANNTRSNHYLTVDGTTATCSQWARINGIPVNRVNKRIKLGWSPEDAISPTAKLVLYHGEWKTLTEWCRALGIDFGKVQQRIKKLGWPAKRAFET